MAFKQPTFKRGMCIAKCTFCGKSAMIHIHLDDTHEYIVCDEHIADARSNAREYARSTRAFCPGLIAGEYAITKFMKKDFVFDDNHDFRVNNASLVMFDDTIGDWVIRLNSPVIDEHTISKMVSFEALAAANPDNADVIMAAKHTFIEYCR